MKMPLITNIQKYSIHDGEGTRTTVFFKGCPRSCKWCHNPETQSYKKEILFYEERCTGCSLCTLECPQRAVFIKNEKAFTDTAKCTGCEACVDVCVNNAREICGRTYEISELTRELLKDQIFYETSHGGVTLSGGEVLARDVEDVENLMKHLKKRGIRINPRSVNTKRHTAQIFFPCCFRLVLIRLQSRMRSIMYRKKSSVRWRKKNPVLLYKCILL